jgi:hypothetical protein
MRRTQMNLADKHVRSILFVISIVVGAAISFILPQLFGISFGIFTWFFMWLAIAGPALLLLAVSGRDSNST